MKKLIAVVLSLALVFAMAPVTAGAEGEGTLHFDNIPGAVTPSGAEIFIDDSEDPYPNNPAPCDLTLPAGDHKVVLKIPGYDGYSTNVTITAGGETNLTDIHLLPELDSGATVITVNNAGDDEIEGQTNLRQAVTSIMNDTSETQYRIEFAAGVDSITLSSQLNIDHRGNFTINGDRDRNGTADVEIASSSQGSEINLIAPCVRIIGLKFFGTGDNDGILSIRPPNQGTEKIDMHDVYILGCEFKNCYEVGLAPCGAYGYAATGYDSAGTFNVTNINFCGNTFDKTTLFSFAGAGDEDYNHINGYNVCANFFKNCGSGIISGDAHTWYVYGDSTVEGNGGTAGQIGFCENNIFENVTISGNRFILDADAPQQHTFSLLVQGANLGNKNNTMQNVTIKNNLMIVEKPAAENLFSSVCINNVTIGDEGKSGSYDPPATSGFESTDGNKLQDITVKYNDFETGNGREIEVNNVSVSKNYQNGTDNITDGVSIIFNKIKSARGIVVSNYSGECELGAGNNNPMNAIAIKDNEITCDYDTNTFDIDNTGVSVIGSRTYDYKDYYRGDDFWHTMGGSLTDVKIGGNTITNFNCGVLAAGSSGYYTRDASVNTVSIINNTITCKPSSIYGIEIFGGGYGNYQDADNPNERKGSSAGCSVQNVTVTGNTLSARGGVSIMGAKYDGWAAGDISGNFVKDVSVKNNTITRLETADTTKQFILFPAVVGGICENWDRIRKFGANFLNNYVQGIDITDNAMTGFTYTSGADTIPLGVLKLGKDDLPSGLLNAKDTYIGMRTATNNAAGEDSFNWEFLSRPDTNGTKDVYTFVGQETVGNETTPAIYPRMVYTQVNGELWDYTITYNLNGGTQGKNARVRYMHDDAFNLPVPTRTCYTFGGWFTNSACTGTAVTKIVATDKDNKIFYAKWIPNKYTIRFNANGGTGSMASIAMVYNTAKALPAATFTRFGYTLAGWRLTANGNTVYANKATVKNLSSVNNATVTLYASWKPACIVTPANYSASSVKLSWTKITGMDGYELYRSDKSATGYKLIKSTTALTYTDTRLTLGKTYYYKLRAYDKQGTKKVYTVYSDVKSIKAAPPVPASFAVAKASTTSIKISYAKSKDANGYEIWYATSANGTYKLASSLTGTSYTHKSLKKGTYYYKVKAYRKSGSTKVYSLWTAIKSYTLK
jgi:uncharacterized repeat protein (TIGR02543 family)